ncbi:MAG: alpha/beta hydrolase [Eubacteriales bacterium]|nr:alpha/beta hydrolase [Eubacteriales bacterium]
MKTEVIQLVEGREEITLTTYIRDNVNAMELPNFKRPAVIVCPGGGYFDLSDAEGEPVALSFMNMGYHAFVLRYSVFGGNGFEADANTIQVKPETVHPNPMLDIGRAILCIREHAEEWGVDPEHIAICGFSAGSHNCAMYSTYWSQPIVQDYFKVEKDMLRPAACILCYTLSDYTYMYEVSLKENEFQRNFFNASSKIFIGENVTAEALDEVSPAKHINADNPPTFLWATSEDNLVPVQHTLRMAHALADANIPFEVHVFEEGPHGLSTAGQSSASSQSMCYPDAEKWLPLCGEWLKKRFALKLPKRAMWEIMMEKDLKG